MFSIFIKLIDVKIEDLVAVTGTVVLVVVVVAGGVVVVMPRVVTADDPHQGPRLR